MRIFVDGMSCGHCVRSVTAAVRKVKADAVVTVSLENGTVDVDGIDDREAVVVAIEAEGYEVRSA